MKGKSQTIQIESSNENSGLFSRTLAVDDRILRRCKCRIRYDGFDSAKTIVACVLGCIFGAGCIAVGAMALKQNHASMSLVEGGASLMNTTAQNFSKGFGDTETRVYLRRNG